MNLGPADRDRLLDRTFLEHRAKLLDLAAFLDRCERASATAPPDRRLTALRHAIPLLVDGQPDRARRVLEHLSDPSTAPLEHTPPHPVHGVPPPDSRTPNPEP
ncbi:MAG: hypothetical protein AAFX76_00570 [Planctomycetota bacterium]